MNVNANSKHGSLRDAKKRGKFNLIDFLLILVILLIVASLVYLFFPTSWIRSITADKSADIQYTIEMRGVDEEFINNINENDTVLDSVSKSNIGTVVAVDYSMRYTELTYNEEGQGILAEYPGKYNVIVTISATAEFNKGEGYTVNGKRIAVGEKVSARFPNYLGEGYCISVPLD